MSNHEETRGGKPKGSDLLTFEEISYYLVCL